MSEKQNNQPIPSLLITQVVDELTKKAVPYQQTLLYAENMLPEHIECAYKTKLLITKTYSTTHNILSLYGNQSSSLALANYNIEYFLSAALSKITSLYDNPNIEINIDYQTDCKKVVLDIKRTSLILFNLISNAVIHSGVKNKQILISAKVEDNNFILSVRDNGKGVLKSREQHLFSAYETRLTTKELKETGGLFNVGTGLAVSKKAAEEMHGSLIHIPTSEGAKFELIIPQNEKMLALNQITNYDPTISEIETYLADSILMLYLEK